MWLLPQTLCWWFSLCSTTEPQSTEPGERANARQWGQNCAGGIQGPDSASHLACKPLNVDLPHLKRGTLPSSHPTCFPLTISLLTCETAQASSGFSSRSRENSIRTLQAAATDCS